MPESGVSCSLAIGQEYLPTGPTSSGGVPRYLKRVEAAMRKDPSLSPDITLAAAHHLVHRLSYEAGERLEAIASLVKISCTTRDQLLKA